MHKDCEQDDNRQGDAQQPQQGAFAKTHEISPFVFKKNNPHDLKKFRIANQRNPTNSWGRSL
jgi:hypothetical protein